MIICLRSEYASISAPYMKSAIVLSIRQYMPYLWNLRQVWDSATDRSIKQHSQTVVACIRCFLFSSANNPDSLTSVLIQLLLMLSSYLETSPFGMQKMKLSAHTSQLAWQETSCSRRAILVCVTLLVFCCVHSSSAITAWTIVTWSFS